jgi:hypothetical protein
MKKEEWAWGEEDAHKACVLKEATGYCKKCDYYSYAGESCAECGKKLKKFGEDTKEPATMKPHKDYTLADQAHGVCPYCLGSAEMDCECERKAERERKEQTEIWFCVKDNKMGRCRHRECVKLAKRVEKVIAWRAKYA